MKKIEKIKALVSDTNVSDEKVKREVSKLDSLKIKKEDKKGIISLLKKRRPDLFAKWQLEIASGYM